MERILVVDDEESIRYTFGQFLAEAGFEVSTAKNYYEAMAETSARTFDLIMLDMLLEGKSGIEFLEELRKTDRHCPVIVITGYPNIITASDALNLGVLGYIAKPVRKETIVRLARSSIL